MRKNTRASRYCRFASKYCRIAGVAPVGSEKTGEDMCSIERRWQESRCAEYNIEPIDLSGRDRVIVLSLDTTTRAGSAAVIENRQVRGELAGDGRLTHGERLPGELVRVLQSAGVGLERVDLLAVAAGPGSFTGLRVGIAAMQGLAVATGRRIVPVSALDALARAVRAEGGRIAAWMDAHRGQVFAALYETDGQPIAPPTVSSPAETLAAWSGDLRSGHSVLFIGDGAVRYAGLIRAELGAAAAIADPPPLAGIIGLVASDAPERAVAPHAVVPIYIRRSDAELARQQRSSRG